MTRQEAMSCIETIKMLRRFAFNIHGVIDVVDDANVNKVIAALQKPKWTVIYEEDGLLYGIPEDGQEVLVSHNGKVWQDTFYNDEGCYFDSGDDAVEGMAWKPMPEPYKEEEL